MRYRLDRSVRRYAEGRVLVGGSPLRLFRLSAAGARLVAALADGEDLDDAPTAVADLLDRLTDTGAVHPFPSLEAAPYGPAEVTVVVPVRNRPEGLDRLLASLTAGAEADRPAEVIVVDDASVDPHAHREVCRLHGARYIARRSRGGPGVARADGISVSSTPLVAVLDSDCVITSGWLSPLLAHMADSRVGAVAARVSTRPGPSSLARYEAERSPLDLGPEPGPVRPGSRIAYVPAAGLLLRRSAYEAVGGFDPDLLVGEDVDLVWRMVEAGWRVRYEPSSKVFHDVRSDLRAWLTQRWSYGSSAAALDARHPGRVAPVSCSPWSAWSWALVAAGAPMLGSGLAVLTAALLPRKLTDVPTASALRLALAGHLGAGRMLARAVIRTWWPIGLLAAFLSRRARKVLVLAAAVTVADAVRSRPGGSETGSLDAVRLAALTLVDDVAYGAGVWSGCVKRRSLRAVLPRLADWPGSTNP